MIQTKYFTIQDLQKILGIGKNTAYKLINNGEIGCIRIGEKQLIRIPPAELEKYIQRNMKNSC